VRWSRAGTGSSKFVEIGSSQNPVSRRFWARSGKVCGRERERERESLVNAPTDHLILMSLSSTIDRPVTTHHTTHHPIPTRNPSTPLCARISLALHSDPLRSFKHRLHCIALYPTLYRCCCCCCCAVPPKNTVPARYDYDYTTASTATTTTSTTTTTTTTFTAFYSDR
jgi:hypothetical protein